MSEFEVIDTPTGKAWLHREKNMWIRHYPMPNGRTAEFYQAYRPRDYVTIPAGKYPWTEDNRRFNERGFPTLEAAMEAIRCAR